MASSIFSTGVLEVDSPDVTYTSESVTSRYAYHTTAVEVSEGKLKATPVSEEYTFRTARKVPKTGVMIVGWGGNNGTTVTARYVDCGG
jgi:myo-inositol-1-phosphate synthase